MPKRVDIFAVACVTATAGAIVGWRGGLEVTAASWQHRMRQWQWRLEAQAGLRIALYIEDGLEFAAALYGAWHAGKTVVLPADILPATCAALRAHVDFFAGDFPDNCSPLQAPSDTSVAPLCSTPPGGNHPGIVIFTSGSTGQPQPIPKCLRQLAAEVETLEAVFGSEAGAAEVVATVSHQHIYGLLFKVLWPLATGRPVHAPSLIYPEQLVDVTAARDCVLVTSPAHLKRLPQSAAWTQAAKRVRCTFSSGGPLALEDAQATARLLGRAPIEVYGSSETGGIAYRQRNAECDDAWRLLPGVEVQATEDDSLLSVRSTHLADDEWFVTSDRVELTAGGSFLLRGRADRVVKIEEKRVSLDTIESALLRSVLVAEARVAVAPGRRDEVAAFVVLSGSGREVLLREGRLTLNQILRASLANGVERVALPRRWRYLDALPVNQLGKTPQALLLALLDTSTAGMRPTEPGIDILERDADRVLLELYAAANLAYFAGHFPGTPILPGVAQVEWAWSLAQQYLALPPRFMGMQALKFHHVIRAGETFRLELQRDAARQSVAFRYFSAAGTHASGRLLHGGVDDV